MYRLHSIIILIVFTLMLFSCHGPFDNLVDPANKLQDMESGIVFELLTDQNVRISWIKNDDATSYRIERLLTLGLAVPVLDTVYVFTQSDLEHPDSNDSPDSSAFYSYTDKGLRYPEVYLYTITGYRSENKTNTISDTLLTSFPVIQDLSLRQISITSVQLRWNIESLGYIVDGYEVFRRNLQETGSKPALIGIVDNYQNKSYLDVGCEPYGSYEYRINAFTLKDGQIYNRGNTAQSDINLAIQKPENPELRQLSPSRYLLSWTSNNVGATGFELKRRVNDGLWEIADNSIKLNRYTDELPFLSKEPVSLRTIAYSLTEYIEINNARIYSDPVNLSIERGKYQGTLFPNPQNLVVSTKKVYELEINWSYYDDFPEAGFRVERNIDPAIRDHNWRPVTGTLLTDHFTIDANDLLVDADVHYRVRGEWGSYASDWTIVEYPYSNSFEKPTSLHLEYKSDTKICKLTWNYALDGIEGFVVERIINKSHDNDNYLVIHRAGAERSFEDNLNGWGNIQSAHYRVRAFYKNYYSEASEVIIIDDFEK